MRFAIRTTLAAVAALAAASTAAVAVPASAAPKTPNPASTPYAMRGWGYGTIVVGGKLPANAAPTGLQVFGCTNRSDIDRENHQVAVNLPGLGSVSAIKTRAWTTREGDTVSAYAQNSIGQVVLSDSPLGTLLLDAVTTTARAYHDASGFHTETNTDLAKLRFQPPVGPEQVLAIPAPGRPIEIPGVATITLAHAQTHESATGARAFANGLKVKLDATDSVVRVAHAVAQIDNGATAGLFHGSSYAVGGNAAGGILDLGRNPLLKMKCGGTAGLTRTKALAGLDLGGQVVLGAAQNQDMAQQNGRRAWGFESSQVASLSLGGGALRIEGVVGRVNVSRSGEGLRRLRSNTNGTSLGKIVVNGEEQELPDTGTIEIPGIAKIQPHVVEPLKNGLAVTALRITVLDGTGAVINLGNAEMQIRRPAPAHR